MTEMIKNIVHNEIVGRMVDAVHAVTMSPAAVIMGMVDKIMPNLTAVGPVKNNMGPVGHFTFIVLKQAVSRILDQDNMSVGSVQLMPMVAQMPIGTSI